MILLRSLLNALNDQWEPSTLTGGNVNNSQHTLSSGNHSATALELFFAQPSRIVSCAKVQKYVQKTWHPMQVCKLFFLHSSLLFRTLLHIFQQSQSSNSNSFSSTQQASCTLRGQSVPAGKCTVLLQTEGRIIGLSSRVSPHSRISVLCCLLSSVWTVLASLNEGYIWLLLLQSG